jgi:DNA-binding SARP family transcriptional activator
MTASGQLTLATQAGAAALAAEPLRESAAEALIEAHLAQRNRFEALRCFRSLAQRLESELGVEPDPALVERLSRSAPTAPFAH